MANVLSHNNQISVSVSQDVIDKMLSMIPEQSRKHLSWEENDNSLWTWYINKREKMIIVSYDKAKNKYSAFPMT